MGVLSTVEAIREKQRDADTTVKDSRELEHLVVVVDVDDDVSEVLGESVIYGEENVRRAVLEYGIKRPEDSDVNAMLSGLNLLEKLKKESSGRADIVVVGGHSVDFVEAQRLIKKRVKSIVEGSGSRPNLYIVSDGEDDLLMTEVLRDVGEISGVKRVIVDQHLGIEGSYVLLFRYLRKAAVDPRFSRYFLGVPGLLMVIVSILSLANLLDVAIKISIALLGATMAIRGFNLEETIEEYISYAKSFVTTAHPIKITAAGVLLASLLAAMYITASQESATSLEALAFVLKNSIVIAGAGAVIYVIMAGVMYKTIQGDPLVLREIALAILLSGFTLASYMLGKSLEETITVTQSPDALLDAFIKSNFTSIIIISSGIAALLEIFHRILHRSGREQG